MWNVLSKEMRMPALAAAACAAVILVASPVSAAPDVVTSNVFLKQLLSECDGMLRRAKSNCIGRKTEEFREYLADAVAASKECRENNSNCDYWAEAYKDRFGPLP